MISRIRALFRRKRNPQHIDTGEWGEDCAAQMLKSKGYKLLGRRVRFGPRFEIDIVARQGDTLVFVEVKTRKNEDFGRPIASVDRRKRHQLSKAALRYMERMRKLPPYIRFDVVEVLGTAGDRQPRIEHIENAFTLDPIYRLPFRE
jgi:putative endonuclease